MASCTGRAEETMSQGRRGSARPDAFELAGALYEALYAAGVEVENRSPINR